MNIAIRGDGIAAQCCGRLLRIGGLRVATELGAPRRRPAIMVSAGTQQLFRDVFEENELFRDTTRIRRRAVLWGAAEARVLEHDAAVLDEEVLLTRVGIPGGAPELNSIDWNVLAVRRPADERHGGCRRARAVPIVLNENADRSACWVESLPNGWLFLVPGWMLAVGEVELEQSRLIRRQVAGRSGPETEFEAHPRIAWPLCGEDWLACGAGAMAFDPLCGDGSGNAIREGILAAAVLRAVARGEPAAALLEHYSARLLAAYRRHLEVARQFYMTGGGAPWWAEQVATIDSALQWCMEHLPAAMPERYRLRGFDLERAWQPAAR